MSDKVFKLPALALTFLFIGLCIPSCHKEPQKYIPLIVGEWKCLVCANDQEWSFDNTGTAKQKYNAIGTTVWENTYHYWQVNDTINFVNLSSSTIAAWKVRFIGDEVMEVVEIGADLSQVKFMERY